MPLHFLQIEQCLNILLTVSAAEKLDLNISWGFIYFSFGDSMLFHCTFSPSAMITKYKLEVTAGGGASRTLPGRYKCLVQHPLPSPVCDMSESVIYTYWYQGVRERQNSAQRESGVWLTATTSTDKSKITCNWVFPLLCMNRSVRSHQVYKGQIQPSLSTGLLLVHTWNMKDFMETTFNRIEKSCKQIVICIEIS